ncbi:hypothetical protein Pfo_026282 [Paulownia fortunei]|nr:hypothetical protein Pfo_026282 [Paulownia fortunei]
MRSFGEDGLSTCKKSARHPRPTSQLSVRNNNQFGFGLICYSPTLLNFIPFPPAAAVLGPSAAVKALRSLTMKILEPSAGALTNFEVLDLLRSRGAGKDPTRVIASVLPSEFKVYDYLEQTAACNQTREIVQKFVDECKKYDLAKAEILNVVNIRPSSAVEVYTIIEECDSRMDEKIDEFVETIVQVLPPHPSQVESNEEIVDGKEETAN